MNGIKDGDWVRLEFTNEDLVARVVHVPSQSGELWEFETRHGRPLAVNVSSSTFISMTRYTEEEVKGFLL